jgi:hypothetical protein
LEKVESFLVNVFIDISDFFFSFSNFASASANSESALVGSFYFLATVVSTFFIILSYFLTSFTYVFDSVPFFGVIAYFFYSTGFLETVGFGIYFYFVGEGSGLAGVGFFVGAYKFLIGDALFIVFGSSLIDAFFYFIEIFGYELTIDAFDPDFSCLTEG